MVALAVIGVLMAAAMPAMADFMERRRVIAVAGELSNILAFSRAEANAIGDRGVSVHVETDPNNRMSCVAVVNKTLGDLCKCYYAPTDICPGSGKVLRLFQLPRSDSVAFQATASAWSGLTQVINFNRNAREQTETGVRLTVTGLRTGAQLRLDLNEAGMAQICSPVGRIGGYPTCS